jgi:hypothetical protein
MELAVLAILSLFAGVLGAPIGLCVTEQTSLRVYRFTASFLQADE